MGIGKTNRKKGHDGERYYAKVFRDLGFPLCITSRYGSRNLDDLGIDIMNVPFNVQIKTGVHKGMNVTKIMKELKERLPNKFPKDDLIHSKPQILIHRKQVGRGKRRTEFDDMVHMSFEDFKLLISKIEWE